MDIKIVTAFLDIGRGNFSHLSRSDDKYFEYFKFWSRLKNDLTVYCQSHNVDRVLEIRDSYGLSDRTHIKIIDNFMDIESEMYEKMCAIEKNNKFNDFRFCNKALSNRADYNYVMCMKWWCLKDAASKKEPSTMMAWLDFGYNHGGERYTDSEDFDFEWKYDFDEKVNVFCLSDPNEMCGIDSLQFQADCFIGHTAVMPAKLCPIYWKYIKEAMYSLMSLDCIDDDQMLELMVYKRHPEIFNVIICTWFQDMELCSNRDFKVRNSEERIIIRQKLRQIFQRLKNKYNFMKRMKQRRKIYTGL